MNAIPVALCPPATAHAAVNSTVSNASPGAGSAGTATGSGGPQDFAAALGATAAPTAPAPLPGKLPVLLGKAGTGAKSGKSAKLVAANAARDAAGSAAGIAGAAAVGSGLPSAGNVLPLAGTAAAATGAVSGGGGFGDAEDDEVAGSDAVAGTAASSVLITAADLSAKAGGANAPVASTAQSSAFSRLLGDGVEHVPAVLSNAAQRLGGQGTAADAADAADAVVKAAAAAQDRGRSMEVSDSPPAASPVTAAAAVAGGAAGAAVGGTAAALVNAAFAVAAGTRDRGSSATAGALSAGAVASAASGPADSSGAGAGAGGPGAVAASAAASDALPVAAAAQARTAIGALTAVSGKHPQDAGGDGGEASATAAVTSADGASAAAQMTAAAPPATDASAVPPARIDAPLNSPEFTQAIASRVSYLVDNNLNGATLQVTPPQLGPIELRVTIEAGHAQVSMSAHNPATLDALQSGAPKLRELLSAQGFAQVSVDVSQRSFQDGSAYAQSQPWTPTPAAEVTASGVEAPNAAPRASHGTLDAYA